MALSSKNTIQTDTISLLAGNGWSQFLLYCGDLFVKTLTPPFRFREIVLHTYFVANQSALIIILCVAFAGSVTIMEASVHMKLVIQSDFMVPSFAALLILKEMGSLVTCLLLGSRVGAGWAAEISSMKISDQIDALTLMGIDPIRYLVVPRLIACTLGGFMLCALANIICLFFAYLVSVTLLDFSSVSFLNAMKRFISFSDYAQALIRGSIFSATIPIIACFYGFRSQPGAEGVGLATTNSLVMISVSIIVLDFLLNLLFANFCC